MPGMNHNPPFKLFELLIFKLILFSFCEWGLYLGVVVIVIVMLLLPLCYCSFSVAETSLVATEKHSVLVVRSVFLLYFAPFFLLLFSISRHQQGVVERKKGVASFLQQPVVSASYRRQNRLIKRAQSHTQFIWKHICGSNSFKLIHAANSNTELKQHIIFKDRVIVFITTRTQKSSITFYLTDTSMSSPQPEPTIVVFTIYTIQLPCNHLLRHAKRIIGAILLPPPQYPALPPPSYILVLVPVVTFSI